jgi:hypothetical protein
MDRIALRLRLEGGKEIHQLWKIRLLQLEISEEGRVNQAFSVVELEGRGQAVLSLTWLMTMALPVLGGPIHQL